MEEKFSDFDFILQQLPADDPRMRQALVLTWYGYLHAIAYALIDDPDQADYAVFETYKTAVERLDRFPVGGDFLVWLTRIGVQVDRKYLGTNQRRPAAAGEPAEIRELQSLLKPLPAVQRFPAALYLIHNLSVRQMAEILGGREKTIYRRLNKGLSMILFRGGMPQAAEAGPEHSLARQGLLYGETLTHETLEEAEAHLGSCRDCQAYRDEVSALRDRFRSALRLESHEVEEKSRVVLDLLGAQESGGFLHKRLTKIGKEIAWVGVAIAIFLALGFVFNRINPLTEVEMALEEEAESQQALDPIDSQPLLTLSVGPQGTPDPLLEESTQEVSSWDPKISADGRWIAFNSSIPDLVEGDTNQMVDVFVINRLTGVIERVSVTAEGEQADGPSYFPDISADGRYVVFTSWASNLTPGDDRICDSWGTTTSCPDIFLHDRQTGETSLVSKTPSGVPGSDFSISPKISADAGTVVFWSAAGDLAPDDFRDCQALAGEPEPAQTSCLDIFVYDRTDESTRRLAIGRDPRSHFSSPYVEALSLSGDGRWLATAIHARDQIAQTLGVTNSPDLYLFDLDTFTSRRLNVAPDGTPGDAPSFHASLSEDGRYVAFASRASNLVPEDENNKIDVFVLDQRTAELRRISLQPDGRESGGHSGVVQPDSGWMGNGLTMSLDGNWIMFSSTARDLVDEPGEFCGFTQTCQNVFLTHRVSGETRQLNTTNLGIQPFLSLSVFGAYAAFMASSTSCDPGNYCNEIYLYDRLGEQTILLGGQATTPGFGPLEPLSSGDSYTFTPHSNRITSVVFSPDGETIATASRDGFIKLISVEDEAEYGSLSGSGREIANLAYSPAGDLLAAVSQGDEVYLWRMPRGNLSGVLPGFSGAKAAAFSPDGNILAIGGLGGIWFWNIADGLVESRLDVPDGDISALSYAPDGKLLAAANRDQTIWVWDLDRGGVVHRLGAHLGKVNAVKFSPDGSFIASASNDGRVNVWRVFQASAFDLAFHRLYALEHGEWVTSVDFSPDSRELVTGSFASQVAVWDLVEPRLISLLFDQAQNQVLSVAFSPDGGRIAAGTVQGELHYWENLMSDLE